jgi:hypothetical protein
MSIYERTFWLFVAVCTDLWVGAYLALTSDVLTKHSFYALALFAVAGIMFLFLASYAERKFWPRLLAFMTGMYCVYESSHYWGQHTLVLGFCLIAVATTFYLALLGRYGRFHDIWQQAKRNRAARISRRNSKRETLAKPASSTSVPKVDYGIGIFDPEPA